MFISSIAKNETYRYHDVPEVFYFDVRFLEMPQVYLLLSCCPCEGRISGIVDVPNACATLAIPITIFDQVGAVCDLPIWICASCYVLSFFPGP